MTELIQKNDLPPPAKTLRGFSNIHRYWDRQREIYAAKILPGEYYVTTNNELIVTVLGSCVSACIRDPVMAIGGMNHFMLPARGDIDFSSFNSEAMRYGNFAMEKLVNDILKNGGRREALEIKLFGGGKVIAHMHQADVGNRNINFAREYVRIEGFNVAAEDLGGVYPRKVIYDPISGKVQVKKLRKLHNETIAQREQGYLETIQEAPSSGDIELFD